MSFAKFVKSLSRPELEAYAQRCGTTANYITVHLLHATKEPRKKLREALANESDGKVSLNEVLQHFSMIEPQSAA